MTKTYEDGYRDGFRDGFKAARESEETRAAPAPTLRGCQCPPGAEISCPSTACGRRALGPIPVTAYWPTKPQPITGCASLKADPNTNMRI